MWNEHFGISVVEGLAAGCIMVAHNSGGPKSDIIGGYDGHTCGFLASGKEDYAGKIVSILKMSKDERSKVRSAARKSADRFSNEQFDGKFCDSLSVLIEE